jgi:CubicO group peptidase (beta-lactamase class C family)
MNNTRWRSDFRAIVVNRAQAYSSTKNGYELNMPFEHIYGHGGLLTTTADLLKWNQLLEKHDDIHDKRITHGRLNNGKEIAYAAGIQHGEVNGVAEIQHSGATAGYRAWLAYYPSRKISVVLLSNEANLNPNDIGRKIAEIYFGSIKPTIIEPDPAKEPNVSFDAKNYAGEYYSDEAECTLRVVVDNNKISFISESQEIISPEKYQFKNKELIISIPRANNIPFKKIK